ncbi:MAG: very short patch repair endonuclease [Clostridia bacterium]|nr:very short patch repair endonuclease [Clostridia bacterium]
MDVFDVETRSRCMSSIHSKNTKPEDVVAKYLFSKGFRYRRNVSKMQGKPDIVLKKYKTVVFVNGCFWHMHDGCKYFRMPEDNHDYWFDKLTRNKERDEKEIQELKNLGWNVIVVWECELKTNKRSETLENLVQSLHQHDMHSKS